MASHEAGELQRVDMSDDMRVVVVKNDFVKQALLLQSEAAKHVADVVNQIESEVIRDKPSSDIPVWTTSEKGGLVGYVHVGNKREGWFAAFPEYGTVDQAANPYVTPVAERLRFVFVRGMTGLLKRGL